MSDARRDRAIVERLTAWFRAGARDLPWRATDSSGRRDPYRALVSEMMLQQTQVSRVLEQFSDFLSRFPTVESLAAADDADVLAAWSGLGYYRRARLLQQAAKEIVRRHGGAVPSEPAALRALPGVGRYTAGAIASLVFHRPEAIVDGNVARVLLRLDGEALDPASGEGRRHIWRRADELVRRSEQSGSIAAFNEGLMELGALHCRPISPRCSSCPLSTLCRGRRSGLLETIPPSRRKGPMRTLHHECVIIEDGCSRRLVERRPDDGLWAGLWQPPTLEHLDQPAPERELSRWLGSGAELVTTFSHQTSHRAIEFRVWRAPAPPNGCPRGAAPLCWRGRRQIEKLALSAPHRRILLLNATA